MTITAMIGVALAAFSFAMAKGWTDSEETQSVHLTANQASMRIMPVMQNAKYVGLVRAGSSSTPAAVMFWQTDANDDNLMQATELGLLEFIPSSERVALYEADFPAGTPQSQIDSMSDTDVTIEDLNDSAAPEDFKAMLTQVNPSYTPRPLAASVTDARFEVKNLDSETQRPSFVYTLTITKNGSSVVEYGAATLRGATSPDE